MHVLYRHTEFLEEFPEVPSLYAIVAAGKSECRQLTGTDPSQYGRIADAAVLGNKPYGYIFWTPLLSCVSQTALSLYC